MSSEKINVSIIVPVYNADKYLRKCIQSIIDQTLTAIEIFLIDDGSSDESWNIIQDFVKRDRRIIAIQQKNAGAAVARNKGLEQAKGEYIGFVDSDDYIDNDYFEQLYTTAIREKADIARAYVKSEIETSDAYQLTHSEDGYDKFYNVKSKKDVQKNKLYLSSSNWLAIYKHSVLKKHNIAFIPEIRTGQDNIFNLHVSYAANKVVFVDTPTYYHMVRRDGSLMTSYNFTPEGLISRALVIEETVRFLNTIDDYDEQVYAARVKDVFDFFHSRLIKTSGINKEMRAELSQILVPAWQHVKYKEKVEWLLRHDARFVKALNENKLDNYITRTVPIRRTLSKAERGRQGIKKNIQANKIAHTVLRPPVKALRTLNKLIDKMLS